MIKVFWHQSDNFGDKLTPYLLDKLGIEYEYVDKGCQEEHYIICGSILPACNPFSIIWGAGIAQFQPVTQPKKICAVRGERTRGMIINQGLYCPEVYGDICELLPRVYYPKKEIERKIGFVPHIVEYQGTGWNICMDVESTIDYLLTSEKVITSSIHIFMTCRIYGVDCEMYLSKDVIGQERKMADIVSYTPDPNKFLEACPIQELKDKLKI